MVNDYQHCGKRSFKFIKIMKKCLTITLNFIKKPTRRKEVVGTCLIQGILVEVLCKMVETLTDQDADARSRLPEFPGLECSDNMANSESPTAVISPAVATSGDISGTVAQHPRVAGHYPRASRGQHFPFAGCCQRTGRGQHLPSASCSQRTGRRQHLPSAGCGQRTGRGQHLPSAGCCHRDSWGQHLLNPCSAIILIKQHRWIKAYRTLAVIQDMAASVDARRQRRQSDRYTLPTSVLAH